MKNRIENLILCGKAKCLNLLGCEDVYGVERICSEGCDIQQMNKCTSKKEGIISGEISGGFNVKTGAVCAQCAEESGKKKEKHTFFFHDGPIKGRFHICSNRDCRYVLGCYQPDGTLTMCDLNCGRARFFECAQEYDEGLQRGVSYKQSPCKYCPPAEEIGENVHSNFVSDEEMDAVAIHSS